MRIKNSLLIRCMLLLVSLVAFTSQGVTANVSATHIVMHELTTGAPSSGFAGAGTLTITVAPSTPYTIDFSSLNATNTTSRVLVDTNIPNNSDLNYNLFETGNPNRLGTDVSGVVISSTGTGAAQNFPLTATAPVGNYGSWSDVITVTVTY